MFDSTGVDTTEKSFGPSKYITFGVQELKINNMEIKVASTGSKSVIFSVEGALVKDPAFEGVDGAKGPIGRISTMYMKSEQQGDLVTLFAKIADALGVRNEMNAVKSTSIEDYVAKALTVLKGKYANYCVSSEQYWDANAGKAKNSLRFPKYDFVEAINTDPAKSRVKFDKDKTYHFKPAVVPDGIGTAASPTFIAPKKDDDLPF